MSLGLKILVGLGVAVAVLLAAAGALVGSATLGGGMARVELHTPDTPDLTLVVPGVLITGAAAASGRLVASAHSGDDWLSHLDPAADLDVTLGAELGTDLRAVGRGIGDLLRALEDCPDVTLVEVEDGRDRVRVIKEGRYLRVRVTDGAGDVDLEVTLPIRTARRAAAHLIG